MSSSLFLSSFLPRRQSSTSVLKQVQGFSHSLPRKGAPSTRKVFRYVLDSRGLISFILRADVREDKLEGAWQMRQPLDDSLRNLAEIFQDKLSVTVNGSVLTETSNCSKEKDIEMQIRLADELLYHATYRRKTGQLVIHLSRQIPLPKLRSLNQWRKISSSIKGKEQMVYPSIVDLHTHFGGALRSETLIEAIRQSPQPIKYPKEYLREMGIPFFYSEGKDEKEIDLAAKTLSLPWKRFADSLNIDPLRVETFLDMEKVYKFRSPIIKNLDLFPHFLEALAQDYQKVGVKYAELSVSDIVKREWLAKAHQTLPRLEREYGVSLRFLVGLWRHSPKQYNRDLIQKVKALKEDPYVVGVDFMGHETNSTRDFTDLLDECDRFRRVHRPDMVIRVHAGESPCHPENVDEAILHGATRIGHGLFGLTPDTVALAKRNDVVFEVNLGSNYALHSVVVPEKQIPLHKFLKEGCRVTLGTDGHGCYCTDSLVEHHLAQDLGLQDRHFKEIRESDERYYTIMQRHFKERMKRCAGQPMVPEMPKEAFHPEEWTRINIRKAARSKETIAFISQMESSVTGQNVRYVPFEKLNDTFSSQTPILFAGASSTSWEPVIQKDRVLLEQGLYDFFWDLDPSKAVIVTGGTDLGLEALVHQAIARHAKEGRVFKLLGALVPELETQLGMISPSLTHATVLGNSWYDKGPYTLKWANEKKGVAYFVGGGNVVKNEIQAAKNLGNVEFFLMKGIPGASDTAASVFPKRSFEKDEGFSRVLARSSRGDLLRSQEMSPRECEAFLQSKGKRVITFLGYSGEYEDSEALLQAARSCLEVYDPKRTVVNIGATALGIGDVYRLAKSMGFETSGIVSTKARGNSIEISSDCDFVCFVEDDCWGGIDSETGSLTSTSEAIVRATHEAIMLGGGPIAEVEAQAIEDEGKDVIRLKLNRRVKESQSPNI